MANVKFVKEKKFKNIYMSVRFLSALDKDKILPKMLLANILNESCFKYPSKQDVTNVLDTMYGAAYSVNSSVIGNGQVIVVNGHIIDPKFLKKENHLLEDLFSLLHEFIYRPLLDENGFNERVFVEAKRNLMNTIIRGEDDPSTHCMYEAMRVAGKNQPLGWGVNATEEDVKNITMQEVVDAYYEMIEKDQLDILILGDVNEGNVDALADKYFNKETTVINSSVNYCLKDITNDKRCSKTKDISQSYITYIYSTNTYNTDKDFNALKVANAILGQLPTSLLFQEVREKNSLCYSIYSALFLYDGGLGISTGVEIGNEEKTMDLIEKQIDRMKSGDFSDEMVSVAQKMLINSLRSTYDSANAIFGLIYRNVILNSEDTLEKMIDDINKVSKKDVVDVMNKLEFNLSYILKGGMDCE